jgi:anti-anti-sigma regulatory factor
MARTPVKPGRPEPRIAVVRGAGEVTRDAIETFDWAIAQAGDIDGAVVDLSLATHIDYKAVVLLVARRRVLKAKGHELAVAAGLSDVRHILRASGGSELQVFATAAEALDYVRGEGTLATTTTTAGRSAGARRAR